MTASPLLFGYVPLSALAVQFGFETRTLASALRKAGLRDEDGVPSPKAWEFGVARWGRAEQGARKQWLWHETTMRQLLKDLGCKEISLARQLAWQATRKLSKQLKRARKLESEQKMTAYMDGAIGLYDAIRDTPPHSELGREVLIEMAHDLRCMGFDWDFVHDVMKSLGRGLDERSLEALFHTAQANFLLETTTETVSSHASKRRL